MSWVAVIAAVVFPNLGGLAGAVVTKSNIAVWYNKQLKKPSWRPPNWAFGPVWTYLYTSMGYASYRIWLEFDLPNVFDPILLPHPLKLFLLQILLNWIWTPIFFGLKHLTAAVMEILILDAAVALTLLSFWEVDPVAGYLLVPYAAWLALATALTLYIWAANPEYRYGPTAAKRD